MAKLSHGTTTTTQRPGQAEEKHPNSHSPPTTLAAIHPVQPNASA